jgi:flagellin
MSIVVNTNKSSLTASRILDGNSRSLSVAMERLSSGKRINSASDDAAGMAVAAKFRADVRSLDQAVRNTNDAISLVNTYDGGAAEIEAILVRMRELATQAVNGTYDVTTDQGYADTEYQQLLSEIDRINENTKFNRMSLTGVSFTFQVGAVATDDEVTVALDSLATASLATFGDISSATLATTELGAIDDALDNLASARATAGAFVNRLGHTVSNLQNVSQRTKEALSGIEDADYAAESAALARGMVLAQAGTAMLAQANQSPQYILALLKS